MNDALRFLAAMAIATLFVMYALPLTGFLRQAETTSSRYVPFELKFILVFLIADAILIGIPAWIHRAYVRDYGKIENVKFFSLFGGITGAFIGEIVLGASVLLIIPYTILMLICAQFYKRFEWWKVASGTYLGGMLVENVINRAPIQVTTLLWVAIFTYPYFVTKIWENRDKVSVVSMLKDLVSVLKSLRKVFVASAVLMVLAAYLTRDNVSPPAILFGAVLPFLVMVVRRIFRE